MWFLQGLFYRKNFGAESGHFQPILLTFGQFETPYPPTYWSIYSTDLYWSQGGGVKNPREIGGNPPIGGKEQCLFLCNGSMPFPCNRPITQSDHIWSIYFKEISTDKGEYWFVQTLIMFLVVCNIRIYNSLQVYNTSILTGNKDNLFAINWIVILYTKPLRIFCKKKYEIFTLPVF